MLLGVAARGSSAVSGFTASGSTLSAARIRLFPVDKLQQYRLIVPEIRCPDEKDFFRGQISLRRFDFPYRIVLLQKPLQRTVSGFIRNDFSCLFPIGVPQNLEYRAGQQLPMGFRVCFPDPDFVLMSFCFSSGGTVHNGQQQFFIYRFPLVR